MFIRAVYDLEGAIHTMEYKDLFTLKAMQFMGAIKGMLAVRNLIMGHLNNDQVSFLGLSAVYHMNEIFLLSCLKIFRRKFGIIFPANSLLNLVHQK